MKYGPGPLTKVLIVLIGLAALASVAWNFFLKEKWLDRQRDKPSVVAVQATPGDSSKPAPAAKPPSSAAGRLGSATNPLRVSLVSFHGYAPALLANGNNLKTQPGSIFAKLGVNIEFVINDDIPTLTTLFESKAAQCAWRTSDFWAQEQPNLRNSGHDARAMLIVDNTQGADAVVVSDSAVQKIEDLAGKDVALLQYTPSHGMLIDAIESSSLTARAKKQVKTVFIKAEEGTAGVRAAFVAGSVKAAVLWDPDLSLALREVKGSRIIYSTKTATNLIYD
ncbi:MAG: flagellar motor protein MotB, partial [Burkholderiaceae bacterium]